MLEQLANTAFAVWIRESTDIYAYTMILTLHAIGLAIVVGVNTAVALRLLGKASGIPLAAVKRFFGVIYFGFWINATSGALLFIAEPVKMVQMPAFWAKMALVAVGMVLTRYTQLRMFGDSEVMSTGYTGRRGRALGWALLTCWYLALIVGRLTGYPDLVMQSLSAIGL